MLTGKELGQAIKEAIRLKIESGSVRYKKDIAMHFNVKPPSIHDWVNNGTIDKGKLELLWGYFSDVVGPDHWGLSKWPDASDGSNVEDGPNLLPFRMVPIVGTVQGGDDGFLLETEFPVGYGDGSVDFQTRQPNAYALRVRGDSMRPRIKNGEFIIVDPGREVNPGDDVVVCLKDGRRMVKELLYVRDGDVTLGSINNGHGNVTARQDQIEKIHYVAAVLPRGAFNHG